LITAPKGLKKISACLIKDSDALDVANSNKKMYNSNAIDINIIQIPATPKHHVPSRNFVYKYMYLVQVQYDNDDNNIKIP